MGSRYNMSTLPLPCQAISKLLLLSIHLHNHVVGIAQQGIAVETAEKRGETAAKSARIGRTRSQFTTILSAIIINSEPLGLQDISLKKTAWARGQGLWTAAVAPRGPMTAKTRPGRTPENGGVKEVRVSRCWAGPPFCFRC
jgi:hypothetical protein